MTKKIIIALHALATMAHAASYRVPNLYPARMPKTEAQAKSFVGVMTKYLREARSAEEKVEDLEWDKRQEILKLDWFADFRVYAVSDQGMLVQVLDEGALDLDSDFYFIEGFLWKTRGEWLEDDTFSAIGVDTRITIGFRGIQHRVFKVSPNGGIGRLRQVLGRIKGHEEEIAKLEKYISANRKAMSHGLNVILSSLGKGRVVPDDKGLISFDDAWDAKRAVDSELYLYRGEHVFLRYSNAIVVMIEYLRE